MKLNNNGWGLSEMLILSAILIFFFGLAIYFIYIFYNSISEDASMKINTSIKYVEKI